MAFEEIEYYELAFYKLLEPFLVDVQIREGDSLDVKFWQPLTRRPIEDMPETQNMRPSHQPTIYRIPREAFELIRSEEPDSVKTGEVIDVDLTSGVYGLGIRGTIGTSVARFSDWVFFEVVGGAPDKPVRVIIRVK